MEYGLGGGLRMYRQMYNAHKFLIGKPEGKKLFRMPNLIWENNIKTNPKE